MPLKSRKKLFPIELLYKYKHKEIIGNLNKTSLNTDSGGDWRKSMRWGKSSNFLKSHFKAVLVLQTSISLVLEAFKFWKFF